MDETDLSRHAEFPQKLNFIIKNVMYIHDKSWKWDTVINVSLGDYHLLAQCNVWKMYEMVKSNYESWNIMNCWWNSTSVSLVASETKAEKIDADVQFECYYQIHNHIFIYFSVA